MTTKIDFPREFDNERNEYLTGIMYADEDYRKAMYLQDELPNWICPHTGRTAPFWRGVWEAAGHYSILSSSPHELYARPILTLKGTYAFLRKFLDFMEEEMTPPGPNQPKWDTNDKLDWDIRGYKLSISGKKAQEVIRALYWGNTISMASKQRLADHILAWEPRRPRRTGPPRNP